MSKIKLEDSIQEIIIKMSDGNPGAVTAIMELLKNNKKIDPVSALGNLGAILSLDTDNIYGADIYVLWNDICDRNTVKMISVIRAAQLGLFSHETLKNACSRQDRSGMALTPVSDLYQKVCERLPEFDKENRNKESV